jgi:putative N6-adenine-specific DNA methylase
METWLYQRDPRFFALIAEGLEPFGAKELTELGATDVREAYRGLSFAAQPDTLYRIVYGTRLCSRVLAPLLHMDCHSTKYLHQRAVQVPWEALMTLDQTFAIQAVTANSAIRHSRYAALTLKDAIADRFRERTGKRPSVDARTPDIALHLYIHQNHATISLDVSGGSLHRRGYRTAAVDAPMQETVAAGLIAISGWTGEAPLIDPFCGSGTLLCEAWMRMARIPAGYLRERFGLTSLPDYDAARWRRIRGELDRHIAIPQESSISGFDIDGAAVRAAQENVAHLPGGDRIRIVRGDARHFAAPAGTCIISNPPYGLRLGDKEEAAALLRAFGDALKQRCAGCEATIYFGDAALAKALGLKPKRKNPIRHGGLDGVAGHYPLFAGPARPPKPRQEDADTAGADATTSAGS